jgi:alanine racemase
MSDTLRETSATAGHGALLSIDLDALAANWRLLDSRAGAAECAAVVKADAYGTGIERAVPALSNAGCRTFFVAHLSEARRLRAVAPEAVLYVLNGFPPGAAAAYAAIDARPVLGSLEEVDEWRAVGGPAALHVDTGMNRLGLTLDEFAGAVAQGRFGNAMPSLVMSHFVSAEENAAPVTARQIAAFAKAHALLPGVPASLCNSSGLFLPDPPLHALARPGYALYGGNPTPGHANPMRPVVRLEAMVMQVREVASGDTIGYNAQWTARRPTRIATLSIGYADGWLRSQSATDDHAGGLALINGRPCPFAGRVSMDLITVDATDLPPGAVKRGDTAVLLGDGITVDDVAVRAGTNGYEILTDLGRRYARHYIGG